MKYEKYKTILEIKWLDAWNDNEWLEEEAMDKKFGEGFHCKSAGYFYREDDKYICLIGSVGNPPKSVNEVNAIPKGFIISIKELT